MKLSLGKEGKTKIMNKRNKIDTLILIAETAELTVKILLIVLKLIIFIYQNF